MPKWMDVSVPLRTDMLHWPGDPSPRIDAAGPYGVTYMSMSAHTGTHIDAPRHFIARGASIDDMPVDLFAGTARVIEVPEVDVVRAAHLESSGVEPRDRVLIKTRNSARDWRARPFSREFVALAPDAAAWLAERGASLVGIDYVSVDPFGDSFPAHEILLGAGIWIIEGLYLAGVPVGLCEFACMPLRLAGADGAPARAVLRQFT